MTPGEAPVRDLVCGMMVQPSQAAAMQEHSGQTYHFCAELCRRKFVREADVYLSGAERGRGSAPRGVRHICPMCPGVESYEQGACPRCGMPLEPAEVIRDEGPDREARSLARRFAIGAVLTIPLLVLAMLDMFVPGMPVAAALGHDMAYILQAMLATPVILGCGWPLLLRFMQSLVRGAPNMFTLIGLGVLTAYGFSLTALLDGLYQWGGFPEGFPRHAGFIEPVFESAASITVLVLLGQVLEGRARRQTREAIRALVRLAPERAVVLLPGGREALLPLDYLEVGDHVRVKVGERIPVDGVVVEGSSHVDEAMLSGEAGPVRKDAGDAVSAGTLNGLGPLVIRATHVRQDTLLARIVQLVGEAQRSRLPVQKLVDHIAAVFVPIVVAVAMLAFLGWWYFSEHPQHHAQAIRAAVDVLVIACPCALGLATPMAVVVGMGRGARSGILFRNADAIQSLTSVDTVVLDKTGTLTEGQPRITTVEANIGESVDEMLALAASVERGTDHPYGRAIVWEAVKRGLSIEAAEDVVAAPGQGIQGIVAGRRVRVGSYGFIVESGTTGDSPAYRMNELRQDGATVLLVAIDGRYAGIIALSDPLRPTARDAAAALLRGGLKLVLLTGDNAKSASGVARQLMITDIIAETLPQDKHAEIRKLQANGHRVAMVGDGINDAPALAAANVGIAMGTGTDVAIAAADVTLVRPDLLAVAAAIQLSRSIVRTIRENLLLAFLYNAVAIPVAAWGLISPLWAAAAMCLSSLSVIVNSLRLRRR